MDQFVSCFRRVRSIDTTKVTLKSVAVENLPALPEKTTMGTTAFSVDGLTGLLTQDATVIVQIYA